MEFNIDITWFIPKYFSKAQSYSTFAIWVNLQVLNVRFVKCPAWSALHEVLSIIGGC